MNHHPRYEHYLPDWEQLRDCYAGQRRVKERGTAFLPATAGQRLDGIQPGQDGYESYQAYMARALFPDLVSDAVELMIGLLNTKPAVITLPAVLEPMRENATVQGESLQQLLRRINEAQLVTGRLGLLLDLPETGGDRPYIALYDAERILNWDSGQAANRTLNLVVLDESGDVREHFSWKRREWYRFLILGDADENEIKGVYRQGAFASEGQFDPAALIEPSFRGNKLGEIPFVFINSKDIVPDPDDPPLLGLSNAALTIYRGEADYRQALYMQAQDTLVIIGDLEEREMRTGAGAQIKLPATGDAKFIGVNSAGLPEMRAALTNDYNRAATMTAQLADTSKGGVESGEALRIRMSGKTATLHQIAAAAAGGLEALLRMAATWVGANPDEVSVTPNTDFVSEQMTGQELTNLMQAKSMGAPISSRTIHRIMERRDMTDLDYDEEADEIQNEEPTPVGTGV